MPLLPPRRRYVDMLLAEETNEVRLATNYIERSSYVAGPSMAPGRLGRYEPYVCRPLAVVAMDCWEGSKCPTAEICTDEMYRTVRRVATWESTARRVVLGRDLFLLSRWNG